MLVTGASSGIGREIAIACARAGARVVAAGRDPTRLAETLAMLAGEGHSTVAGDLREPGGRATVAAAGGSLHGIVHCAGTTGVRLFRQIDAKFVDDDFAINFSGPWPPYSFVKMTLTMD